MSKKNKSYGIVKDDYSIANIIPENTIIWDMHAHLDMVLEFERNVKLEVDKKIAENPNKKIDPIALPNITQLADMATKSGIKGIIQCACEIDGILNISQNLDLIEKSTKNTFGAIAIHPNEAVLHYLANNLDYERNSSPDGESVNIDPKKHQKYNIDDCISLIESQCKLDSRIKIIGETGLDYFRTNKQDSHIQKESLQKHIELAKSLDMPVQIHDRDAHDDIVAILLDQKPNKVLFHSFSGDLDLAEKCIENGWYASFSGPVTFKANNDLRSAFLKIYDEARELLLIETDSPFLTPAPYRGRTNTPAMIPHTIRYLAMFILETNGFDLNDENLINDEIVKFSLFLNDNAKNVLNLV